eukprot:3664097-Pyramimonas_sp.AAC.1
MPYQQAVPHADHQQSVPDQQPASDLQAVLLSSDSDSFISDSSSSSSSIMSDEEMGGASSDDQKPQPVDDQQPQRVPVPAPAPPADDQQHQPADDQQPQPVHMPVHVPPADGPQPQPVPVQPASRVYFILDESPGKSVSKVTHYSKGNRFEAACGFHGPHCRRERTSKLGRRRTVLHPGRGRCAGELIAWVRAGAHAGAASHAGHAPPKADRRACRNDAK